MESKTPFDSPVEDVKNEIMEEGDAVNRRKFLKTTGVIAGGAILGQSMFIPNTASAALMAPNITGGSIATSGAITLEWGAVTNATGYKIYYGTESNTYLGSIDTGNVTTYTKTDIPFGVYYLAVAATFAGGGEGDKSLEIKLNLCIKPPHSFVLVCIPKTLGYDVTVLWTPVAGATAYKMYYGKSAGSYEGSVSLGAGTSHVFNAVPAGASYYVALSAVTPAGESGLTNPTFLKT